MPRPLSNVAIIGMGPVGLATGLAFALEGHDVVGLDTDTKRVESIRRGQPPFYEPALKEILRDGLESGSLRATTHVGKAVEQADFIFVCVGTPARPDGYMDDSFIRRAATDIVNALPEGRRPITVIKSTVLPGTTEGVIRPILNASGRALSLAVNPEFLREGRALEDSRYPDRLILGVEDEAAAKRLRQFYAHVRCPVLETDLRTAEAIKYGTNAFLATKVAYANEMANLCQVFRVDSDRVLEGVALDARIDPKFLVPGVGFGGSCFPKDLKALVAAAKVEGKPSVLFEAVLRQNDAQYRRAIELLREELGELRGKRIALLGLAFKGGTDDVRESRAIPIAKDLLAEGAEVVGYDPVAMEGFHQLVPDVRLAKSVRAALAEADACILQADWKEFEDLEGRDFVLTMRTPIVVDGRRILTPARMIGVTYRRIG